MFSDLFLCTFSSGIILIMLKLPDMVLQLRTNMPPAGSQGSGYPQVRGGGGNVDNTK
jgi:hypothetical protein